MALGFASPPSAEVVQLISVKGIVSPEAFVRFAGDVTCRVALAGWPALRRW